MNDHVYAGCTHRISEPPSLLHNYTTRVVLCSLAGHKHDPLGFTTTVVYKRRNSQLSISPQWFLPMTTLSRDRKYFAAQYETLRLPYPGRATTKPTMVDVNTTHASPNNDSLSFCFASVCGCGIRHAIIVRRPWYTIVQSADESARTRRAMLVNIGPRKRTHPHTHTLTHSHAQCATRNMVERTMRSRRGGYCWQTHR